MNISTLYSAQCILGESPLWHPNRNSCFWADIHSGNLYEYNWLTGHTSKQYIAGHLSLVMQSTGDQLLLAVQGGLMKMDLATGHKTWLTDLDKHIVTNRCNDGACDTQGRLWVGTMDTRCADRAGSLYRVDRDGAVKKMIGNLTIPNGLVWSMQNDRMYFIDTPSQNVFSYLFNSRTGDIIFEKIAVQIPVTMGMPDGMTIDAEGMLWVAIYNGGCITRWDPRNGQLISKIKLPALHITSCAFAGENLDSLFVTSARENLTAKQLEDYPGSGDVFLISDLPVSGLPNNIADFSL